MHARVQQEVLRMTAPLPTVNFYVRLDLATEECRRRLQAELGLSAPRLVGEAFLALERDLRRRKTTPSNTADSGCQQSRSFVANATSARRPHPPPQTNGKVKT